jgi:hypothetical protein
MKRSPRILMGRTEAEVGPGETARYPFLVEAGGLLPAAAELGVSSDHAYFNPRWARVVRATDDRGVTQYLLEVTPVYVRRGEYGPYLLCIRWAGGAAEARCELIIRPAGGPVGQPEVSRRAARDAGAMTR